MTPAVIASATVASISPDAGSSPTDNAPITANVAAMTRPEKNARTLVVVARVAAGTIPCRRSSTDHNVHEVHEVHEVQTDKQHPVKSVHRIIAAEHQSENHQCTGRYYNGEMPNRLATLEAPSTNRSAPLISRPKPRTRISPSITTYNLTGWNRRAQHAH